MSGGTLDQSKQRESNFTFHKIERKQICFGQNFYKPTNAQTIQVPPPRRRLHLQLKRARRPYPSLIHPIAQEAPRRSFPVMVQAVVDESKKCFRLLLQNGSSKSINTLSFQLLQLLRRSCLLNLHRPHPHRHRRHRLPPTHQVILACQRCR